MKKCTTCTRVYDDDSLAFCLDDGATLEKHVYKTAFEKLGEAFGPAAETAKQDADEAMAELKNRKLGRMKKRTIWQWLNPFN